MLLSWPGPASPCTPTSTQTKTLLTNPADGVAGYAPNLKMPKRKVLEGVEPRERAKQRRQLGTLRQLTVQPATRRRYENAVNLFLQFLRTEGKALPHERKLLDPIVCDYVEHLWSSGAGRALANDTLAGLQDAQPNLRSNMPGAWRLLKTWSINEVPSRAPPLPEHLLHAMIGWAFFNKHFTFGISLVLGYYGMLRSGEIISMFASHIMVAKEDSQVLVSLGLTKSGKRQGAAESVIIGVELAVKLIRAWKVHYPSSTRLATSPGKWRSLFSECLIALGLESFQFRPYSLRRGGATWWFQKHQSLDRILVQGRWAAPKTARIYLNEGLEMLARMQFPKRDPRISPFLQVFTRMVQAPNFTSLCQRAEELRDVEGRQGSLKSNSVCEVSHR